MDEKQRGWASEKRAEYNCTDETTVHMRTYPLEKYEYGRKFRKQSALGTSNSIIYTRGYKREGTVSVSGVFMDRNINLVIQRGHTATKTFSLAQTVKEPDERFFEVEKGCKPLLLLELNDDLGSCFLWGGLEELPPELRLTYRSVVVNQESEKSLIIPEGKRAVKEGDFQTRRDQTKIVAIPASVQHIEKGAFRNWKNLESVIF